MDHNPYESPQSETETKGRLRWKWLIVVIAYQLIVLIFVEVGGMVSLYELLGYEWNEPPGLTNKIHSLVCWLTVQTPLIIGLTWYRIAWAGHR